MDFMEHVGESGAIAGANEAKLELVGYFREEYVEHIRVVFHADEPSIGDILPRLRNEQIDGFKSRIGWKDGSIRHLLISSGIYREDGSFCHDA